MQCSSLSDASATHSLAVEVWQPVPGSTPRDIPVLLVHALTRNRADFDDLAQHLSSEGFLVAAVDVVGRGDSDYAEHACDYAYPQYAADMRVVLDELGWPRTHWVGTSMGGLIAITFACQPGNAGVIAGLVLNDVGPHVPAATLRAIVSYAGTERNFLNRGAAEEYLRGKYSEFKPMTDGDWEHLITTSTEPAHAWMAAAGGGKGEPGQDVRPGWEQRAVAALWDADGPCEPGVDEGQDRSGALRLRVDARLGSAFPAPEDITEDVDLWLAWQMVSAASLLVLRGVESKVLTQATAERMIQPDAAPGIPGPKELLLITIPGCGHVPSLRDAWQARAIATFLQRSEG